MALKLSNLMNKEGGRVGGGGGGGGHINKLANGNYGFVFLNDNYIVPTGRLHKFPPFR